jgi:hypothetical protein
LSGRVGKKQHVFKFQISFGVFNKICSNDCQHIKNRKKKSWKTCNLLSTNNDGGNLNNTIVFRNIKLQIYSIHWTIKLRLKTIESLIIQ